MADDTKTLGFLANRPLVVSALYLATLLTGGLTCFIGVVLAYIFRAGQHEDWEASHFAYQIRTFWMFAITIILVLASVVIGLAGYGWAWFLGLPAFAIAMMILGGIRSILSIISAVKEQPMPNPHSWLI